MTFSILAGVTTPSIPLSRTRYLYGLLVLAFFIPVISSTLVFLGVRQSGTASRAEIVTQIAYELLALGALYLVLGRQNRNFNSIGFSGLPNAAELGHSVLLFLGAYVVTPVMYVLAATACTLFTGHPPNVWHDTPALFGDSQSIVPLVFMLLNPFYEELLVRGYLITEAAEVYGSSTVGIVASVTLQTSYHLYQGVPSALALSAVFLMFSVYFVKTRRLLPIVLAHLYLDVFAFLSYAHATHR